MTGWQHFTLAGLPVTPWRNGGGETREILSAAQGNTDFDWRASIATIAQDGPFSAFPGIDRSITLLSGAGAQLLAPPDISHSLTRAGEPFAFPGELAITARLTAGVTTDFNIMTRRAVCHARVIAARETLPVSTDQSGVIYVVSGEWQMPDGRRIRQGEGFYRATPAGRADTARIHTEHPDSLLLWAAIVFH